MGPNAANIILKAFGGNRVKYNQEVIMSLEFTVLTRSICYTGKYKGCVQIQNTMDSNLQRTFLCGFVYVAGPDVYLLQTQT